MATIFLFAVLIVIGVIVRRRFPPDLVFILDIILGVLLLLILWQILKLGGLL